MLCGCHRGPSFAFTHFLLLVNGLVKLLLNVEMLQLRHEDAVISQGSYIVLKLFIKTTMHLGSGRVLIYL